MAGRMRLWKVGVAVSSVKVWRVGMLPLKKGLGDSAFGRAGAWAVIGLGVGRWKGRARRSMRLEGWFGAYYPYCL